MSDPTRYFDFGLAGGVYVAISSAASAKTAELEHGMRYVVTCTVPCHIRLGATGSAATAGDTYLAAGTPLEIVPSPAASFLHGIAPAGGAAGTLIASPRRLP